MIDKQEQEQGSGFIRPIKGIPTTNHPIEKVIQIYGEELKIDEHGFLIKPLPEEPDEDYIQTVKEQNRLKREMRQSQERLRQSLRGKKLKPIKYRKTGILEDEEEM